jgi:hypothetical protein
MNVTLSSNVYAKLGKMESILQAPKERAYTKFYFDIKQLDQVWCKTHKIRARRGIRKEGTYATIKRPRMLDVDTISSLPQMP